MVQLKVVHAQNEALCTKQPLTAVFVGGTSGIGEYAVRALASAHGTSGQGLRLYIVGRNEATARNIISDCQKSCPAGQFNFVHANDLTSIKDVDRVCSELVKVEETNVGGNTAKIDLLVMTQGTLYFDGRRGKHPHTHTLS
jgi:NAD(P)-dependent dehydrogenase (short-subunit alcohol dehydrogenase family)